MGQATKPGGKNMVDGQPSENNRLNRMRIIITLCRHPTTSHTIKRLIVYGVFNNRLNDTGENNVRTRALLFIGFAFSIPKNGTQNQSFSCRFFVQKPGSCY